MCERGSVSPTHTHTLTSDTQKIEREFEFISTFSSQIERRARKRPPYKQPLRAGNAVV
jgi:hypothetical protein